MTDRNESGQERRDPDTDFPIVRRYAGQMLALGDQIFGSRFQLKMNDHFGFMTLCYGHTQIEHARSVGILVDSYQYADSRILARVMLEGLIHLAWAFLKPDKRGARWRGYAGVHDWKLQQMRIKQGKEVEPLMSKRIDEHLAMFGEPYLTKEGRKKGRDGAEKPYQDSWMVGSNGSRITLKSMAAEIGDPGLYTLYSDFSQLTHWSPAGIGEILELTDKGVQITFSSTRDATQACAVAFQSLGHTIEIASQHFGLSRDHEVRELFKQYKEDLGIGVC